MRGAYGDAAMKHAKEIEAMRKRQKWKETISWLLFVGLVGLSLAYVLVRLSEQIMACLEDKGCIQRQRRATGGQERTRRTQLNLQHCLR